MLLTCYCFKYTRRDAHLDGAFQCKRNRMERREQNAASKGNLVVMNHGSDVSSFGSLLKDFRGRRKLTQQQLADAVGAHRNAISRWEQGNVLPESKSVVLELARILQLDYQEGRQLLEASFAALVPPWNVPYMRNPLFTGREEYLEMLHHNLSIDQIAEDTQSYALYGLGGIGKTQLAIEYVYRYALEYTAVLWINAEQEENVINSFLAIAEILQLPERLEANQKRVVIAVQRWLNSHSKWLLIWDNLEDMALLPRFLASAGRGAILITTRQQALGTQVQAIELATMTQETGVLFLLRRAKIVGLGASGEQRHQIAQQRLAEYTSAQELVELMDGLPLALDQAGAYVEETGCGLSRYLRLYEQQCKPLLSRRGIATDGHPLSVTATVLMTYEHIKQTNQAAAELICLCAFLHPDAIPEELLELGADALGPILQPLVKDHYRLDQAIALLRSFSLINRYSSTGTLSIHRLVQAVLRESLAPEIAQQWVERTTRAVSIAFPPGDRIEDWPTCQRYLPHVDACARFIKQWNLVSLEAGHLLYQAGAYARRSAQYVQAQQWLVQARDIRRQMHGPSHLEIAECYHELAYLHARQGNHQEAILLYQKALDICAHHPGREYPHVAESLNELAALYWRLARYGEAEPLFLRALSICEGSLGSEHPKTAIVLSNLARLYIDKHKYVEAESLFWRARRICEQHLGAEHPDTAVVLSGLARLYANQKKYEQAEPLLLRALHANEQHLGTEHPDTAIVLISLARLYTNQRRYEEAEPLLLRALRVNEQHLGTEHPDTAIVFISLARLYIEQESHGQAEPLLLHALHIYEHLLGKDHPRIATILADLGALYTAQGRDEQATVYLAQAQKIRGNAG